MKVGVAKETAPGERRVALVPEALGKLTAAGLEILVEAGAGAGAAIPDSAYADAGATVVSTDDLYGQSDVVLARPEALDAEVSVMRKGQAVLGLLQPLIDPQTAAALADAGRHGDQPRRDPADAVSRAQTMDALSSQANVGGYKAVLIAANDVRPLLPAPDDRRRHGEAGQRPDPRDRRGRAPGDRHGPAARRRRPRLRRPARDPRAGREPRRPVREAQDDDRCDRRRRLRPRADAPRSGPPSRPSSTRSIGGDGRRDHDRPGPGSQAAGPRDRRRRSSKMKPGSVIVDMAASALGGNCELSQAGETIMTDNGVDDHRPGQPAGHDAGRRVRLLRPEHLRAPARDGQGRRR